MLLGMASGENDRVCVQDFGVDNRTAADGLAVGRASAFVGGLLRPFLSGCYSLSDERMYKMLARLADTEGIYLEPSALVGMYGPFLMEKSAAFRGYIAHSGLDAQMLHATHLVWATGGNMVPRAEMEKYYSRGKELADRAVE